MTNVNNETANTGLERIALLCLTPEIDADENGGETLPTYGIHRIQAALLDAPALNGVEVRVFDAGKDDVDAYLEYVEEFKPQLVGVSLFVWSTPCMIRVAREVRKRFPETLIVFGGPSARTALLDLEAYRNASDYVDVLVTREGEGVIALLADAYAKHGSRRTGFHEKLASIPGLKIVSGSDWIDTGVSLETGGLDRISSPYQMGLMRYGEIGYLETFRGCPMSCMFCEWGEKDIQAGVFSTEYLVRELEALSALGAPSTFNVDAGLNLNARAFDNLAAAERQVGHLKNTGLWCEIYPSKIKDKHLEFLDECGPSYLGVGLQALDKDLLKRLERPFGGEKFEHAIKQLKDVNCGVEVQIIFGLPTDEPEGFLRTLSYARELGVGVRAYHCLVLPDALLTRGKKEWEMEFAPDTLAMKRCVGWTEQQIQTMREHLTSVSQECGGTYGGYWWSIPA